MRSVFLFCKQVAAKASGAVRNVAARRHILTLKINGIFSQHLRRALRIDIPDAECLRRALRIEIPDMKSLRRADEFLIYHSVFKNLNVMKPTYPFVTGSCIVIKKYAYD
jgi:hypothetical protein